MINNHKQHYLYIAAFLTVWALLFVLPFARSLADVASSTEFVNTGVVFYKVAAKTFLYAGGIAFVSVLLGYFPGKLLAFSGKGQMLLIAMIVPLVLPRYVQYYCWSLLLSPTTCLGKMLSANSAVANTVGSISMVVVLVLWYWPVAGLLLAAGWRNIGSGVVELAEFESNKRQRFVYVILPLLFRNMLLCFLLCFVLVLSEFATFHLGGVSTIGTELAVLYELTGSEAAVFKAGWPMIIAALAAGYFLHRELQRLNKSDRVIEKPKIKSHPFEWSIVITLIVISVVIPVAILIWNINGTAAFTNFFKLHADELGWSLMSSACAVLLACFLAAGAKKLDVFTSAGPVLRVLVYTSIFAVMLMPGSLIAASLLKTANWFSAGFSQGWWMVSIGQAVRVCGVALILFKLSFTGDSHHYSEMANVDGASSWARFRYIYLPENKHFIVAVFLLLFMLCFAELPATMILLGAGVPNFAQRLLNQMHYARDDQVIASCLILITTFTMLAVFAAMLLKRAGRSGLSYILLFAVLMVAGCKDTEPLQAKVVGMFGQTGRGKVEFIYPRAIDIDGDVLYVIDKVGRVQKIGTDGEYFGEYSMPAVEAGKPTGITIGPDGNVYVADTHYHRVAVLDSDGKMVNEFGKFGEEDGEFIYPTDVAFADDGRIFVSEYGGNDRISVFNSEGEFQYKFGKHGNDEGQLSRPSALYMDNANDRLYVADACNHRIAVYTSAGQLVRYIGRIGTEPGQLRYPYDLAMNEDGHLVVCEYGNNRIQIFNTDGKSVGLYGSAGRDQGQLAFPWGDAVSEDKVFILDAGNNRIQIWQF